MGIVHYWEEKDRLGVMKPSRDEHKVTSRGIKRTISKEEARRLKKIKDNGLHVELTVKK